MEKLVEDISFQAGAQINGPITIDASYVNQHLGVLAVDEDLARYVL